MNFWKKMPLSRAVLPFVLGIFLALELKIEIQSYFWIVMVSIFCALIFIFRLKKSRTLNSLVSFLILTSMLILGIHRGEVFSKSIEESALSQFEIEEIDSFLIEIDGGFYEKEKSYKTSGTIKGIYKNGRLIPHHERTLLYIPKDDYSPEYDKINELITTRRPNLISSPKNPAEFDYQKYLKGLGISCQFYLPKNDFRTVSYITENSLPAYFSEVRASNLSRLQKLGIKDDVYGVVSALVFGQKDHLDEDLYNAYGAAGATHVLAVSGLHVGLIYIVLAWLLKPLLKSKSGKWLSLFLILAGLWFYAAITGCSPSVLRACTMFSFISVGRISKNSSNIFNTIAASALCLLLLKPNLIMEVGFQLSYSAVLGILLIQPWLYRLWTPKNYLLDKSWQIVTVSIAAQAGTFPLALLYFHQFPNYFILSNLFVIPLATFILYLTLIVLALSYIPTVWDIAEGLAQLLSFTVKFLNHSIRLVETLPMAKTEGIDITILECFILYIIIGSLVLLLTKKQYNMLKWNMGFVLLLCALQCKEKFDQSNQSSLNIHVIQNERAISIIEGSTCYFICSEELWNDQEKKRFHISHFWDRKGIKKITYVNLSDSFKEANSFNKEEKYILFKDYLISLGRDVSPVEKVSKKTIVLLDEIPYGEIEEDYIQYLSDGSTKKKYLLKKSESSVIMDLQYCLVI